MSPRISIIIPCYNHGKYLPDALFNLDPKNTFYELIIVNDGSTEKETIKTLESFRARNYKIIDQENMGLAAARNTGISSAKGEFIMLLDADNSIDLDFLKKAVQVFESEPSVDVVYSDAEYFGTKSGKWVVGEFNLQRLMIANFIDACAMVRKSVFDQLGGYDTKMKEIKSGWEDWEMWLRIAFSGKKFRYLPQIGFRYRVTSDSMIEGIKNNYENRNRLTDYLHKKYPAHLGQKFITDFVLKRFKPHPLHFLIKLSMIAWFNARYQKLLKKNKIVEGI
ncbi:MAG TPA: glycosyltransferase family A protein [Hanamia sp.]|nr:glycosyltransferase family A protein [Hanamia sp.]